MRRISTIETSSTITVDAVSGVIDGHSVGKRNVKNYSASSLVNIRDAKPFPGRNTLSVRGLAGYVRDSTFTDDEHGGNIAINGS